MVSRQQRLLSNFTENPIKKTLEPLPIVMFNNEEVKVAEDFLKRNGCRQNPSLCFIPRPSSYLCLKEHKKWELKAT